MLSKNETIIGSYFDAGQVELSINVTQGIDRPRHKCHYYLMIKSCLILMLLWPALAFSAEEPLEKPSNVKSTVPEMMEKLKSRITPYKWDKSIFSSENWSHQSHTVNGLPLIYWTCGKSNAQNRALILSGVHGDEVTPIYFGFRVVEWLKSKPALCDDKFVVIAPIVNPDGFLRYRRGTRTNWNKVDVNRNFDTPDWKADALRLWKSKFASQRRYFPGDAPESEPETKFQKWLIEHFKPSKIMSVHAPLNMLDFDGPENTESSAFSKAYVESCESLKDGMKKTTTILKFFAFGMYPGSLGNYAGKNLGIPTITPELPSINPQEAGYYFGEMEQSTRLFLDYKMYPKSDSKFATTTK